VEEKGYSFSVCAFALAAFNGDMSLMDCLPILNPTKSQIPSHDVNKIAEKMDRTLQVREIERLGFSWGPPSNGTLSNLQWVPEINNPKRMTKSDLTPEGLSTLGYLFLCDLIIDVSIVQKRFQAEFDQYKDKAARPPSLDMKIIWNVVSTLVINGFHVLAQVIWTHECDFCLSDIFDTAHSQNSTSENGSAVETIDVPRDLSKIFDIEHRRFIFRSEHPLIQNEHDFMKKMAPKPRAADRVDSRRDWFVRAAMTGRLNCGRQLNAGFQLQKNAMTSFNVTKENGPVITPMQPEPDNENKAPLRPEDMFNGQPKAKYTSVFESESVFQKAVYIPAIERAGDPRNTLHAWRPEHWIAKRIFKGSAGDLWKIEGGDLTRGYWGPTALFSSCILT
jgi:hypothetical protein